MNIFSQIKNLISRPRGHPVDNWSGSDRTNLFGLTTAGENVNNYTAMQTTAVYCCVRILAEAIASLPINLCRYTNQGTKERIYSDPLYALLHDAPNPDMTSFVFRETMMSHLLLWGNAYAQIIRDGAGRVVSMYPLMPDRMTVSRDSDTKQIYYDYCINDSGNPYIKEGQSIRLDSYEVLHIAGLGFDGLIGYSPIAMAKNAVGMTIAADKYGASFFANGATPSGVLEYPGVLKDPTKVRDSWDAAYRGAGKAHKTVVLEEGMKYTPVSITPEESQFLQTRKFQIDESARLYRIPPHMLADLDKSSFSNIEQQSLEFVKYTLDPWVIRWEQAMELKLLTPAQKSAGYFIKLNVDGLLRGDYASRMAGYATARQNGWMSANDIRALEDMNPIPADEGGDLYLVNGSMTKLSDAGAFAGTNSGGVAADG